MKPGLESAEIRAILTAWAQWLSRRSGYARQSSLAVLQDGGGSGMPFQSSPPSGSMPSQTAERASIAMQRLRDCDPYLAGILEIWYLRKNETAVTLAQGQGLAVGQFHSLRKSGERKYGEIYSGLMDEKSV